jgi:elongation factor G
LRSSRSRKPTRKSFGVALAKLAAEDPSFRVSTDQESGQTILKGDGRTAPRYQGDILKRTYKVDANIGAPQVAFREKITHRVEHGYTHKKQDRRLGQFAQIKIIAEPTPPGTPFEFENEIVGGAVPKNSSQASRRALRAFWGPAWWRASRSSTSR